MAKFGWNERALFYVNNIALENLSSTPSDAASGQMLSYIKSDHLYIKKPSVAEVLMPEDGLNIGASGYGLFKQKNTSAQLEFYKIASTDGHLDITLEDDILKFTVDVSDINDELDHGLLQGLSDDDHSQYFLLAGRAGGQVANGGSAASEDLELKSTSNATKGQVKIVDGSSFQHSDKFMQQYTVQTTDDTETAIATLAVADEKVVNIKAVVVANKSDFSERASWDLEACIYRSGGGATTQGSTKQHFKTSNTAGLDADIEVSGNNILVNITGKDAETFNWKAYVETLTL